MNVLIFSTLTFSRACALLSPAVTRSPLPQAGEGLGERGEGLGERREGLGERREGLGEREISGPFNLKSEQVMERQQRNNRSG